MIHYKKQITAADIKRSFSLNNKDFAKHKYAYFKWLREHEPVKRGNIMFGLKAYFITTYEDCELVLKDQRFFRNRTTATGGARFPFPLPKSIKLLMNSMINMDNPEHKRLRGLVHKAFTHRHLGKIETRIESLTHELLDKLSHQKEIEIKKDFARPIPVAVIADMVGVDVADAPRVGKLVDSLSDGFSGFNVIKGLAFDLPKSIQFVRELIERKRKKPADDILTALIEAEEEGEKLSEDELVAMVFLLIIAGYETTYNLITNMLYTLLRYPDQLAKLRANPDLIDTAVEEVMRYNGPIYSTKMEFPNDDIKVSGTTIPKGASVMCMLGSANHDAAAFDQPEVFDITRKPNRHLGFGTGAHYCLGAPLARMETKIAIKILLERSPDLRFAVPMEEIEIEPRPGWNVYRSLPLKL